MEFLEQFTWNYVNQVDELSFEAAWYMAAEALHYFAPGHLFKALLQGLLFAAAYALLLKAVPLVDKQLPPAGKTDRSAPPSTA